MPFEFYVICGNLSIPIVLLIVCFRHFKYCGNAFSLFYLKIGIKETLDSRGNEVENKELIESQENVSSSRVGSRKLQGIESANQVAYEKETGIFPWERQGIFQDLIQVRLFNQIFVCLESVCIFCNIPYTIFHFSEPERS